ncbi:acetamidase/formamidase [Promicromonospora sp. AC04]|uniref:acetamidase/formamidase family protein n=1 Tax=Promicromonospora sp. AC04 TaxID=2135723 RepID=UPI000D3D755A|nr:acetamidase/formamidase family protein [Promicromonospora sp. AC04]PUB20316.1 acetamidase/formamidase [Promicromonospora sp. AC04]
MNHSTPAFDACLKATRDSSLWGWFPTNRESVLTVPSGSVVKIDAVNQMGVSASEGPVTWFERLGVPADDVLPELADIATIPRTPGSSGHVLTGPLHVEGAEPGDVLEVEILDLAPRVPYGVNVSAHGSGVLPDLLEEPSVRLLRLDEHHHHYDFGHGIRIPFRPFAGIMAVAPPTDAGFVSANPPDRWGGNMDIKDLTAGSTLHLPVFQPGAQFYVGDTHGAQGHGEINQTAVEHSMSFTARFTVRKGASLTWPRAELPGHHLTMGAHPDLDVALQIAATEAIRFLREQTNGALSDADAYALCSLAVDFVIAEAVDGNKIVAAYIPKPLVG